MDNVVLLLGLKPTTRWLLAVPFDNEDAAKLFYNEVASTAYDRVEIVQSMTAADYIEKQ
jgi:hypothetical protein